MSVQSPYLKIMGIQQWVRRDSGHTDAVDDVSRYLELSGESGSSLLIITTPLNQKENTLLESMLQAIDIDGNMFQQITVVNPEMLSQQKLQQHLLDRINKSPARVVLQLGGDAIDHVLVESTFHPSHLLNNGADKRHAWETLKKVKKRIDG